LVIKLNNRRQVPRNRKVRGDKDFGGARLPNDQTVFAKVISFHWHATAYAEMRAEPVPALTMAERPPFVPAQFGRFAGPILPHPAPRLGERSGVAFPASDEIPFPSRNSVVVREPRPTKLPIIHSPHWLDYGYGRLKPLCNFFLG
jgi:hypothetical protein